MENIRALIVDDELPARDNLRVLLSRAEAVEIVGECANGLEAIEALEKLQPDLLFLDVQMPQLSGFDVLRLAEPDRLPVIVFVTAWDQYALRAFAVSAFDYLLKPFTDERFAQALERARAQIRQRRVADDRERLAQLLAQQARLNADASGVPLPIRRLAVKNAGRVYLIGIEEIDWIAAAGSYVELHAADKSHLLRESLNGLQTKLDPQQFIRIHRSTIVNAERVRELRPCTHGEYLIVLHDGTQLKLSRSYRDRLTALLAGLS